jgi:hypothetical protein
MSRRVLGLAARVSDRQQYRDAVKTHGGTEPLPGRWFRFGFRIVLLVTALAYLSFMVASHSMPFCLGLEVPLVLGGWLLLAIQLLYQAWRMRGRRREMTWRTVRVRAAGLARLPVTSRRRTGPVGVRSAARASLRTTVRKECRWCSRW